MYALFDKDKQISKAHSTKEAAMAEAFERKKIFTDGKHWLPLILDENIEVRRINDV